MPLNCTAAHAPPFKLCDIELVDYFTNSLIHPSATPPFPPPSQTHAHARAHTRKVCLPKGYWDVIRTSNLEVPWVVRISRLSPEDIYTSGGYSLPSPPRVSPVTRPKTYKDVVGNCDSALASPLDFRALPSTVFLPDWLFRALGLRPGEVVRVHLVTSLKKGSSVKLRPLTFPSSPTCEDGYDVGSGSEFLKITGHQSVLETELKHYSTLTSGSVVSFVYNGKRFFFEVEQTRSGGRIVKNGVKVMDCDVAVEFGKEKRI